MECLEKSIKELEAYLPPLTRRPDFDSFWSESIAIARLNPLSPRIQPIDYPLPNIQVYDISFLGFDSTRIHGWLLVPINSDSSKIPCLIHYHGFTGNRGLPFEFTPWLMLGAAVLSVDCREQGGDTGNNACYSHGMVSNVTCKGILDKNEYYFRAVYMDCLKAVDFAISREEIDPSRIVIEGGSQGGALGMAVCAMDHRPALAMLDVPSNSNLVARVEGANGSFAAVFEYIRRRPEHADKAYETLSYFDVMNMAESITCPVYASVGLKDDVCPAKHYFASYNRIVSPKQISVYPFNGHEGGGAAHQEKKLRFLAAWLSDNKRKI
ncbi:MAG: acetylxylan esterase [Clostridiales bacterium]|jgi:cephalosporin-C deacetylase|nr:acetylxylan esterase [Clostridiales bacterium]